MTFDPTGLSDGDLAALSRAGRQAAFAEILRRYREPIFRIIAGSVDDADEALDLLQETFLSAHAALDRYDPGRPLRAWLTTIALNKCRDWGRRRAVRRLIAFALPIDGAAESVAEDRPPHDIEAEDREELARVSRAITELPSNLRNVLVLRTIEGLSQEETAAMLGLTGKAVETRLRRARLKLIERVARR